MKKKIITEELEIFNCVGRKDMTVDSLIKDIERIKEEWNWFDDFTFDVGYSFGNLSLFFYGQREETDEEYKKRISNLKDELKNSEKHIERIRKELEEAT